MNPYMSGYGIIPSSKKYDKTHFYHFAMTSLKRHFVSSFDMWATFGLSNGLFF